MRRFILIGICLCASVILFAQQSFANLVDMSPSVFASTVEQTGTWSIANGTSTYASSGWSSHADYSWFYTPPAPGTWTMTQSTSTDSTNMYFTDTYTGGTGTLDFYHNGTEYTVSVTGGSDVSIYAVYLSNGTFNPSASSIKIMGPSLSPIDYNGKPTGFDLNNIVFTGTIDYYNLKDGVDALANGRLTSATGSITGSPVPAPGALWLLGSGLVGLVGIRRRFKQ